MLWLNTLAAKLASASDLLPVPSESYICFLEISGNLPAREYQLISQLSAPFQGVLETFQKVESRSRCWVAVAEVAALVVPRLLVGGQVAVEVH